MMFNVDPAVAARAGFTPQEIELDASAILQGEPAPHAGGGERPRLHHSRALSGRDARHRWIRSAIRCSSAAPARPRRSVRWPTFERDPGPDGNPPREPAARRAGDRALRRTEPGRRHGEGAAGGRGSESSAQHSRASTAGTYEEQQKSFHDLVVVLVLAIVLVFMVLLFEFGNFAAPLAISRLGAAFHLAACFWRCWSPARRSTSRRSWA